jgi:hypothetical protein
MFALSEALVSTMMAGASSTTREVIHMGAGWQQTVLLAVSLFEKGARRQLFPVPCTLRSGANRT